MGYKIMGFVDNFWRQAYNPAINRGLALSSDAMQLILAWRMLRKCEAFQSKVLVVPPDVCKDMQSLCEQYVTLSQMDLEAEDGRTRLAEFDTAVSNSTAALFVLHNLDMFSTSIIVYVCESFFTQSWTCTVAVNPGYMKYRGIVSGYMHAELNVASRVEETVHELDPLPEDGFLWFLNVAWHLTRDASSQVNRQATTEVPSKIPVPLPASPFGEEGRAASTFSRIQFKAPCTFLDWENKADSGFETSLNVSQIISKWPLTMDWRLLQPNIREHVGAEDRVFVLQPGIFGLTTTWTVCEPG
jgi:hypothetical protein